MKITKKITLLIVCVSAILSINYFKHVQAVSISANSTSLIYGDAKAYYVVTGDMSVSNGKYTMNSFTYSWKQIYDPFFMQINYRIDTSPVTLSYTTTDYYRFSGQVTIYKSSNSTNSSSNLLAFIYR